MYEHIWTPDLDWAARLNVSPALCLNDSVGNVVLVEIEQTIQECFGILQDLLGKAPNITKLTAQSLRQHLGPSRSLVLGVPLVQRFCAAAWKLPGLLTRFPVVVNLFARRVGIIFLDLARWLVALDTGDCRQHLRIALASVETSCNQDISRYIKMQSNKQRNLGNCWVALKTQTASGWGGNITQMASQAKRTPDGGFGSALTCNAKTTVGPMTKWSMLRQHCGMLMY